MLTLHILLYVSFSVCYEITVANTLEHAEVEGKYVLTAEQGCGGKPSWKHESRLDYLYELELHSKGIEDRWFLGNAYCTSVTGKLFFVLLISKTFHFGFGDVCMCSRVVVEQAVRCWPCQRGHLFGDVGSVLARKCRGS